MDTIGYIIFSFIIIILMIFGINSFNDKEYGDFYYYLITALFLLLLLYIVNP